MKYLLLVALFFCVFGSSCLADEILNQTSVKMAFVERENLAIAGGFSMTLAIAEKNAAYESLADVVYKQRGNDYYINISYLKTTAPTAKDAIRLRREYSVTGTEYRQMNWFTGQGLINTTLRADDERCVQNNIPLPNQFWLDYGGSPLSSLVESHTPIINELDASLTFVLPIGKLVFFLSPEWGLLVKEAHDFTREGILLRKLVVEKAKPFFGEGVFLPEEFTCQSYGPGANNASIPLNKLTWTVKSMAKLAPGDSLEVIFPKGAVVANNSKGTVFQVGNPSRKADPEARMNIGQDTEGSRGRNRLIFLVVIVVASAVCVWIWTKNRRKVI